MNKYLVLKLLNEFAKKEFGDQFEVTKDDGDLVLRVKYKNECGYAYIAWFNDFDKNKFTFNSSVDYKLNTKIVKDNIINTFYNEAVAMLTKYETKYTIQVFPNEYGFLRKRDTDWIDIIADELSSEYDYALQTRKGYFTQSEIDELKKHDDIAIDWSKAIIEEVRNDG